MAWIEKGIPMVDFYICTAGYDLYISKNKEDISQATNLKARDQTHELCPTRGETQQPLEISHNIIVPSSSPDAIYRPSGDIASDNIMLL